MMCRPEIAQDSSTTTKSQGSGKNNDDKKTRESKGNDHKKSGKDDDPPPPHDKDLKNRTYLKRKNNVFDVIFVFVCQRRVPMLSQSIKPPGD